MFTGGRLLGRFEGTAQNGQKISITGQQQTDQKCLQKVKTFLERTFDTLIMEKAALELETKFDETEKRLDKV